MWIERKLRRSAEVAPRRRRIRVVLNCAERLRAKNGLPVVFLPVWIEWLLAREDFPKVIANYQ
jgi:hypothetical protein